MKAQFAITISHRLERASEHLRIALVVAKATSDETLPNGRGNILIGIKAALKAVAPALEETQESITSVLMKEANE